MRLDLHTDHTAEDPSPHDLLEVAREASQVASDLAMSWRQRADQLNVEQKTGPWDLVSQADREVEDAVRAVLGRRRPDDAVLGEEAGKSTGSSGVEWVIDPIDGTLSYLYGLSDWTVSLAARSSAGELLAGVVAAPVIGRVASASRGGGTWVNGQRVVVRDDPDLTHALVGVNFGRGVVRAKAGRMVDALVPRVRHVRRGGSTAASLTDVAIGCADAAWTPDSQPWDIAAGVLLVQEAGGLVGDLADVVEDIAPPTGDVLAASPGLWEQLRALLAQAYAD